MSCLCRIAVSSVKLARSIEESKDKTGLFANQVNDPLADLSLVAAMCLLKVSGLRRTASLDDPAPLNSTEIRFLLKAIFLLDVRQRKSPQHVPLRMFLCKLYLLVGCVSLAHQLWAPMDVKRTIQDSLSPLFFDRLSDLSPSIFRPVPGRPALLEPLKSYYTTTSRAGGSKKMWESFEGGNYSSIWGISEYMDRLASSCTAVMAAVEDRRSTRLLHGKVDAVVEDVQYLGKSYPKRPFWSNEATD